MKKLLSILALALCFVACQNEGVENPTNGDLVNVVLSVDAPELGVTRADEDNFAGKNSAYGAIDFMNDADWANYDLRYILEVYDANDNGEGEPIYRERLVNCLDKYAPTEFELRLVPNRDYKFVVFADFVAEGSAEANDMLAIADLYYNTADLRNISAITAEPSWNAMNEVRDAYFVSKNLSVATSLTETLTLTRPFAKLRVIATDLDYIAGYSAPGYVEVTYHTEALYKSFNAVNGMLNDAQMAGDELKYSFNVNKNIPYSEGYDAEAKNQTLFADYLFAREGQQIPVNFTMSVYESEGGRLIKTTDFNTQIPVQRNHLTTIIGDVLTTEAKITVVVDDKFEDEWINPTMETIDAPVVTATAKANTVTLTWEAVEGAAKYFTRLVTEGNTAFEETTELTKDYADLAWETEYTFEVYAVSEKGLVSETTAVKATTEKAPVALTAPVVTCSVNVNVVTLTWDAVEGAAYYTVQVDDDVEEKVEATTYVFEGDYEVEYMFTVKAIAADYKVNYDSEAAVVKATTEAEPVVTPTETKLYFQPNSNWKVDNARFAAYFFGNGETWVDLTLVEGETDIYELTLPAGYPNIIFCRMTPSATANNWNNKWNQTADLVVPTDGKNFFILANGSWDGATTSWSTYTPAVVEPETPAVVYTTVAEFLAAEVSDDVYYTLKGTITSVANTSYGNFDLTDETGTVYVYGLYSEDGATNKYWAASGAKLADDIVISAVRSDFNGSAQAGNARFIELSSPGTLAFYTVDPAAVDFTSAGGEQDIEVFAYNTTAAVTATSDNSAFDVNVNGYVITVTAAVNELEEAVTGNITIKVGDLEAKVVKVTLAAKPASGVVEGGSDDFNTISATNTSYVSGKTTAGWSYTNCAIFKGGTSDNSPAFKMIGDDSNRALCMNGKTSAVGKITSPTLTTGCGTLKFNYGLPFSDTKIKFRVDIIQNGAVVKTFTVDKSSASKVTKYSHEEEINVAGEFQIVFTNLSPSNSTSNKDRTAIWDVEWTGCN